jgi:RNA polymerase sigma factor (sigma-70 family)
LREGDSAAEREIFDRYATRLSGLAEQHLGRGLKRRIDGADIVQSVFHTFFKRSARGEFQIDSSSQIWRLLVHITMMRLHRKVRYHLADRRSVAAEESRPDDSSPSEEIGREPDPAAAADLVDQIQSLLAGLPDLYCHVLDWRLQGYSVAEIANKLGISRRTVYRALDLLQERLMEQAGDREA